MSNHVCKFCGKQFETGVRLGNHVSKQCPLNPNRGKCKNAHTPWKCSICGETFPTRRSMQQHRNDEHVNIDHKTSKFAGVRSPAARPCKYCGAVLKYSCDLSRHEARCKLNPNRIAIPPRPQATEETRRKISSALKKFYAGKTIWYTSQSHHWSYAERYFSKIFPTAQHNYHVNRYFLDFAWSEAKIYIEVDGEQHYTPKGLLHDAERTKILAEHGWTLITRIRWSSYNKLSHADRVAEINRIKNDINYALKQ